MSEVLFSTFPRLTHYIHKWQPSWGERAIKCKNKVSWDKRYSDWFKMSVLLSENDI